MSIAARFRSDMDKIVLFVDLIETTFDLARNSLDRFRSRHPVALAAKGVHAKARAVHGGLPLASEGVFLSACAQFEQCIRDIIEEAASHAINRMARFDMLPQNMQKEHLNGCAKILQHLGQDKYKYLTSEGIVTSLHSCLPASSGSPKLVLEAFSSNEKNFKPNIIAEHMKRLGVEQVWERIGQQTCLQKHLGLSNPQDCTRISKESLERIMDQRNYTIHRSRSYSAPSTTQVREHASYFAVLTEAIAGVLVSHIASL